MRAPRRWRGPPGPLPGWAWALGLLAAVNVAARFAAVGRQGGRPLDAEARAALPDVVAAVLGKLEGGQFTLFSPTREAWRGDAAPGDRGQATSAVIELLYDHVVEAPLFLGEVPAGAAGLEVHAVSGRTLRVTRDGASGAVRVEGVPVLTGDFTVGEGVVHFLDGVLQPGGGGNGGGEGGSGGGAEGPRPERAAGGRSKPEIPKDALPDRPPKPEHHHAKRKRAHAKPGRSRLGPCWGNGAFDEAAKACTCAVMFEGALCNQVKRVRGVKGLSGHPGSIVLNRQHLGELDSLAAVTPTKTLTIAERLSEPLRASIAEILPETDPIAHSLHGRCALVGSSGILMRYEFGKRIDEADLVIRFNSAPTHAYEKYVGSKTTYRISNGEHLGYREGDETVIHHLKARSFLEKLLLYNVKFNGQVPLAFDPSFTEHVAEMISFIPSSGFFAIAMALQVCRQVELYGFHASIRHGARHHYYNMETPSNVHRDDTEFNIIAALSRAGLLSFAEPCIIECHREAGCEECLATPIEELAALERWTPAMRSANEEHKRGWEEGRKWDWGLDRAWRLDDEKGFIRISEEEQARDHAREARKERKSKRRPFLAAA